jgi:hypothetical protein
MTVYNLLRILRTAHCAVQFVRIHIMCNDSTVKLQQCYFLHQALEHRVVACRICVTNLRSARLFADPVGQLPPLWCNLVVVLASAVVVFKAVVDEVEVSLPQSKSLGWGILRWPSGSLSSIGHTPGGTEIVVNTMRAKHVIQQPWSKQHIVCRIHK